VPLLLDGWADWDVDAVRDDARDYPVELLDTLAGANLAAWGEHELDLCACATTQVGNRHPGGPPAELARHACGGRVSAATSPVAAVPPGETGTSQPRVSVA
jgi:putative transposase